MLNLPKPYISWSQLSLWERSQEEYKKQYFLRIKPYETKAMRAGTEYGEGISFGEDYIPEYIEYTDIGGVQIMVKVDFWNPKIGHLIENKTGKEWTQERVNEHGQLLFYYLGLNNPKPERISLTWQEAKNGEINEGAELKWFERSIPTPKETEEFKKRIVKAAEEISKSFTEFQKSGEIQKLDTELEIAIHRKIEAEKEVEEAEKNFREILEKKQIKEYKSPQGTVYERATMKWKYDTETIQRVSGLKEQVKKIEEEAQKNGKAEKEVSTSISFRVKT